MINIAVVGCCGKMGKRIVALAKEDQDLELKAAIEAKNHPQLTTKIDEVTITDDLNAINDSDVVIDFTPVADKAPLIDAAIKYKKALVIGTTGLSADQVKVIKDATNKIPIVYSPNMSRGVNLLFGLLKEAASKLKNYDIRIKEAHHVHKKDAPSGTAKKIAEIISNQTNKSVTDIKAIREGEIIGDHEVVFESDLDTIVLSHSAKTRDIFVSGSLEAAKWIKNKENGFYDMSNVIGLNK